MRNSPLVIAQDLLAGRFRDAIGLFVAGSVVRGEASSYSDLDLIVVFPKIEAATRESFYCRDWLIEAHIHDPQTLGYFLEVVPQESGLPELQHMMIESLELPRGSKTLIDLRTQAQRIFEIGPPQLSDDELLRREYLISTLLDDLREPRTRAEQIASAAQLYQELGDYFLRRHGRWSAVGKALPKKLKRDDLAFYQSFSEAFEDVFRLGKTERIVSLTQSTLTREGQSDLYRWTAPADWRREDSKG